MMKKSVVESWWLDGEGGVVVYVDVKCLCKTGFMFVSLVFVPHRK